MIPHVGEFGLNSTDMEPQTKALRLSRLNQAIQGAGCSDVF